MGVAMQDEKVVFENFLRTKNLKHSKPRYDILGVFLASDGHLTAHELFQQAKEHNPSIGFATVYRTLKLLEECGLARTMDYGDGTLHYEPNRFQHHHIICTSCNRTVEFLSPELESLLRKVQEDHLFTPQMHAVRILSVCTACKPIPQPRRRAPNPETIVSRDALQVAIANEQGGVRFYGRALEVAPDEAVRAVFARLMEEEENHLAVLQNEYDLLCQTHPWLDNEPAMLYVDLARLENIFPDSQEQLTHRLLSTSPAEALSLAMSAERRSYEFFNEYAEKLGSPQGRLIFQQFAAEEQQHLVLIQHAYNALQKDTSS